MKRIIAGVLVLALTAAVLPATFGSARAGGVQVGGQAAVMVDRTAEPTRWWGVAGAIVCGLGGNFIRHFGPVDPGVVAATIGGCVLAIMDVAST